jgi:tetratricopeptide (TPR) repeat protein
MDVLEILINHIEAIYGSNSLESSNIYFYCANYLNFLNQPNKAFACFLKAAKLRGEKSSTSYYNAGIICLEMKNFSTGLDVLLLALNGLTEI